MTLLSLVSVRQASSEAGQDMFSIRIARRGVRVRHPLCLWWRNADHSSPLRTLSVEGGHCFGIEWLTTSWRLEIFRYVAARAAKENVASLHEGPIAAEGDISECAIAGHLSAPAFGRGLRYATKWAYGAASALLQRWKQLALHCALLCAVVLHQFPLALADLFAA